MNSHNWRTYGAAATALVAVVVVIEVAMGSVPICQCGYVKVWHGVVFSSENSQHLSDWYSFTHVIHGVLFYALLWLVARRLPPGVRFVLAVLIEASWEVLENTPYIIDRYRTVTISLDYYGDSIVNSIADILAMMLGFEIARRTPVWVSVAFVIVTEVALALAIRDNLTLNIVMLAYPLEFIKQWQDGG
jgi:hypothetical protein